MLSPAQLLSQPATFPRSGLGQIFPSKSNALGALSRCPGPKDTGRGTPGAEREPRGQGPLLADPRRSVAARQADREVV